MQPSSSPVRLMPGGVSPRSALATTSSGGPHKRPRPHLRRPGRPARTHLAPPSPARPSWPRRGHVRAGRRVPRHPRHSRFAGPGRRPAAAWITDAWPIRSAPSHNQGVHSAQACSQSWSVMSSKTSYRRAGAAVRAAASNPEVWAVCSSAMATILAVQSRQASLPGAGDPPDDPQEHAGAWLLARSGEIPPATWFGSGLLSRLRREAPALAARQGSALVFQRRLDTACAPTGGPSALPPGRSSRQHGSADYSGVWRCPWSTGRMT